MIAVTVARGRTVDHGGKHHGPGSILNLSPEEAAYLRRAGFLMVAEGDDAASADGPTVNGENGSVVKPQ